MADKPVLTTTAGNPVADNQNTATAGPRGPALMQDYQLLEKLAHQNRERIPERTVHAKGVGAFGTLTVTHDITRYTKAKLFSEVGKTTEMLARFSTVAGERGAAEDRSALADGDVGFLAAQPRKPAPGDDPDVGSRPAARHAQHAWLWLACVLFHQCAEPAPVGQIPLQDDAGHQKLDQPRSRSRGRDGSRKRAARSL